MGWASVAHAEQEKPLTSATETATCHAEAYYSDGTRYNSMETAGTGDGVLVSQSNSAI